jgi:Uma2 family endonuclease
MAQPAVPLPAEHRPDHDRIVVLRGATWADYQRLLEMRGEKAVPRLTYLEGAIEIMSPSQEHESIKSWIGCLVEAYCLEMNIDISAYGFWTHESKESERGAEPDECYVLGDVQKPERADLAIEVVWTSGGLDKLEVYRKLHVREVWVWKDERIDVFELRGERYERIERSALLPALDLTTLLSFVGVKPMTRAIREYRAALRSAGSATPR